MNNPIMAHRSEDGIARPGAMPSDPSWLTVPADAPPTPAGAKPGKPPGIGAAPTAHNGASAPSDFLAGGGEMGRLMRAKRWADTPLGPPETWPQSLKTVVRGQGLRSVFHDEGRAARHGPWPQPDLWLREAVRRSRENL
jgi:hypothetical protein